MPSPDLTSWYDWPHYYDIAMDADTPLEADFIEAAARKYCSFPVRRLLEPGCGSGRLIRALAARHYQLLGLDLSQPAIEYARERSKTREPASGKAELWVGDMSDFQLSRPVDAAYNLCNTFRHLLSEDAARRHLECVAAALRPGGIYLLGLHLLPLDVDEKCIERWSGARGNTRVTVTLRVLTFERRRRRERVRISMLVRRGSQIQRLRHEFDLRLYTAAQFRRLLRSVPALEMVDVFDFWYDLDEPLKLDDEITDTVVILRKRAGDGERPRREPTRFRAPRPRAGGAGSRLRSR